VTPIAVYVHVPFCTVKCGYCDFNAYSGMDALKPAYREAVVQEVESWRALLGERRVASVAFGGGTPGEVPPRDIGAILDAIRSAAGEVASDAEIGLEANPGTTRLPQLRELRAAGVNRVSFGVQSFDAANLHFLDRIHSAEAAAACVGLARRAGFANVGLDLIYGLPGQAPAAWEQDLARAISLDPDHISCYALTVEEGTPLARRVARGQVTPLEPDVAADLYEAAEDRLSDAGYVHYELSNWAKPGCESAHNRVYWTGGDYLGLGAGAHGFVDGVRYENAAHPRGYVERLTGDRGTPSAVQDSAAVGPAVSDSYRPTDRVAMFDWLETSLRLVEGFDPAGFAARFGVDIGTVVGTPLRECVASGVLDWQPGRIALTRRGRQLHSGVAAHLLAHLDQPDCEGATLARR
jgi:oxygen-independent coproporphyrinogen-3 oxidase